MYRLILLLAFALIADAASAASPYATIPYDELHDILQKAASAGIGLDHIDISTVHVSSVLCGITAADIHMQMQPAGKPAVALHLAEDGSLQLPVDPALYKENPLIVSNQPKGTLNFNVSIRFIPPKAGASDYRTLMEDVDQINTLIHREAGLLSWFAPKAKGLVFLFGKEPATLTIHTPKSDTVMQSEANPYKFIPAAVHIIQIKYDNDLYASNPGIDLSIAPKNVIPLMDTDTMKKMMPTPDEKKCKSNP